MIVRGHLTEYRTPEEPPAPPAPAVVVASRFDWDTLLVVAAQGRTQSHVVPYNDIAPHRLAEDCACRPVEDLKVSDVWTHNSWDGRECAKAPH